MVASGVVGAVSSSLKSISHQLTGLEFFFDSGDIALGYFIGRSLLTGYLAVFNKRNLEVLLLDMNKPCVSNDGMLAISYSENRAEHSASELAGICLQISEMWEEFKNNGTLLGYTRAHPLSFTFGALGGSTEFFQIIEKFNRVPFAYFLRTHAIFIVQELHTGEFVVVEMQAGQLVHAGIIVVDDADLIFYKFSDCVVHNSTFSVDLVRRLTDTATRLLYNCQLTDRTPHMKLIWNAKAPLEMATASSESPVASVKAAPDKAPLEDKLISRDSKCNNCGSHGFYTLSQQCDGCCSCCQYARDYRGSSIKVKTRQQYRLCNDCANDSCGFLFNYENYMRELYCK